MIEVSHLTKRYGSHTAVSDLSFTIEKGKVYGFLGPNGAGKSTTMNMITGCLGATDGEVKVDGHNVLEEPMEAKRLIGYLPELPPLYTEMTPEEYLRFVLQAKGVPKKEWDAQLRTVMDKTRLHEVKHRVIANLSKGYRQRVGIAQALLGNPQVIILDEPTVGLDPAQIIEIRELIRELGHDHTLVLSSHILSEVQAVCDHVMIIAHGKLVASDTSENLTRLLSGSMNVQIEAKGDQQQIYSVLSAVEGVEHIAFGEAEEDGVVCAAVAPKDNLDIREALFKAFAQSGMTLLEMRRERATLEDVFLELTQDDPSGTNTVKEGETA